MNENILKDIINIKLRIADSIIDKLPSDARERVRKAEKSFITVIHEATGEYTSKKDDKNEKKNLKSISIE